jgi:hypothetical protein
MTGLVQQHVDQWVKKYPKLADFFSEEKFVMPMLKICEIITQEHPRKEEWISNFISGLVMIHASFRGKGQDGKVLETEGIRRTMPVFDLVIRFVKSNSYREAVLDSANLGDTVTIGNVQIPVTTDRMLKFLKERNTIAFNKTEIRSLAQEFIDDRFEFNKGEKRQGQKQQNKFIAKEMGYILFYLLETTNIFPYTKDKPTLAKYAAKLDKGSKYSPQNIYSKGFNPLRKFNEDKEWLNSSGLDIGAIEKVIPFLEKHSNDAAKMAKDNIHEIAELRSANLD